MKWKSKPYPKDKDIKVERKFALFPVRLDNNMSVWFEYYYSESIYIDLDASIPFWVELKRYQ